MAGVLRTNKTIGAPANFVFQWKFSFIKKKKWINKNRNFAWLKTEKIVTKPNLSQQIEIKSKRTPRSSTGGLSNVCIDGWLLKKKKVLMGGLRSCWHVMGCVSFSRRVTL